MKLGIKILPRPEILDVQGRAVQAWLVSENLNLQDLKVGKYIRLEVGNKTEKEALAFGEQILEKGLYNPLIETYELEVLKALKRKLVFCDFQGPTVTLIPSKQSLLPVLHLSFFGHKIYSILKII